MSRVCPQCNQVATESTAFCIRCGYRFQGNEQVVSEDATIRQASLPNIPSNADPAATLTPGGQSTPQAPQVAQPTPVGSQVPQPTPVGSQVPQPTPVGSQAAQPTPSAPQFTPVAPQSAPNLPAYAPPAGFSGHLYQSNSDPNQGPVPGSYGVPNTPPQGAYPQPVYGQPYGAPLPVPPASSGVSSLQRAFAGKGVPVHHQSWLLDGKQVPPATLRNSLMDAIHKQGVMGVRALPERLREHGVAMEERDFIRVQYGAASVYVYLAPMGQNLYVSRTSTIQQPLSRARVATLVGLAVLLILSLIFFSVINPSTADLLAGNDFTSSVKAFFGYAFYGLLFFFFFVLIRSIVSWLTDNDFLAFLRPNRLSDFTLDTLSSVEHITDKGIRETLRQAGLNADEITRPAQSYAPQQALSHL